MTALSESVLAAFTAKLIEEDMPAGISDGLTSAFTSARLPTPEQIVALIRVADEDASL